MYFCRKRGPTKQGAVHQWEDLAKKDASKPLDKAPTPSLSEDDQPEKVAKKEKTPKNELAQSEKKPVKDLAPAGRAVKRPVVKPSFPKMTGQQRMNMQALAPEDGREGQSSKEKLPFSDHASTIDEMQDQVEQLEEHVSTLEAEQGRIKSELEAIKASHLAKASEKALAIYFNKIARSVQRELGSKTPISPGKMEEESAFGEIYQSDDSKALSTSAELLSQKLEILGLNLIEFKKFK